MAPPRLFDPEKAMKEVDSSRKPQEPHTEISGPPATPLPGTPPEAAHGAPRAIQMASGDEKRMADDFRVFLTVVWRWLDLGDPSPLQLSVAWWMQHGPDRSVLMGFRGMAKSWMTAAFTLWSLYRDPQKKILAVSGSLKRAAAFTNFCLYLINEMPILAHLRPKRHQRQSALTFDVGPSRPADSPSCHACGVFGQMVGFRADDIVADDLETNTNSLTTVTRDKIIEAIKEFPSILKPGGTIRFLGTPHSEDSLYPKLPARGYTIRIWPARFPGPEERKRLGDQLAPYVKHQIKHDPDLVGHTTEPTRFTDDDLAARELEMGKTEFALQFLLDTSLADAGRFPLRMSDLIVMGLDPRRGPDLVTYGRDDKLVIRDLPSMGFQGDLYHGPAHVSEEHSPWSKVYAYIDPSGRGADEAALAIVAELHGMVFALHVSGYRSGFSPETLDAIAEALVRFGVSEAGIEEDYGGGMFTALLGPYVQKAWRTANKNRPRDQHGGTRLVEERAERTQKEFRILAVMEPVTQAHRLVVDRAVIEADHRSVKSSERDEESKEARFRYSVMHQYAHLTRELHSLTHEDRLEALANAIKHFSLQLGIDPMGASQQRDEERMEEELEALFNEARDLEGKPPERHVDKRARSARPGGTPLKPGQRSRR